MKNLNKATKVNSDLNLDYESYNCSHCDCEFSIHKEGSLLDKDYQVIDINNQSEIAYALCNNCSELVLN